jgi:hypothetical protein
MVVRASYFCRWGLVAACGLFGAAALCVGGGAQAADVASTNTPAAKEQPADKPAAKPAPTPEEEAAALKAKIHRTLNLYFKRGQHVDRRSPWAIMHWIVAFGVDSQVRHGYPGNDMTAIGFLCFGGRGSGQSLLYVDSDNHLRAFRGPGVEGHDGQFLGYLSQGKLKSDYPIKVGDKSFTVADLIESEKRTCRGGTELTYKLMGLGHYLPTDSKWKNDLGEDWSVERLIREELAQDVRGAACGGSHRLMGLSTAVRKRRHEKKEMTGEFWRADKFINDYHKYAFSMQNGDGSFSTEWFWRKADSGDTEKKLDTTGHILEWMVYSLPEERLTDPRVLKAVNYLSDLMLQYPDREWAIGPLGHALHALVLYEERVFKSWQAPLPPTSEVAERK